MSQEQVTTQTVQLTQEELDNLLKVQQDFANCQELAAHIKLKQYELEILDANTKKTYNELMINENKLNTELSKKYGPILNIDFETGVAILESKTS